MGVALHASTNASDQSLWRDGTPLLSIWLLRMFRRGRYRAQNGSRVRFRHPVRHRSRSRSLCRCRFLSLSPAGFESFARSCFLVSSTTFSTFSLLKAGREIRPWGSFTRRIPSTGALLLDQRRGPPSIRQERCPVHSFLAENVGIASKERCDNARSELAGYASFEDFYRAIA